MVCVAVIGLGYVGLPLVVEFGKKVRTIGYDIDFEKALSCKNGVDPSKELAPEELGAATLAEYTTDTSMLSAADYIIVAVPTPVDNAHVPDFRPLISASKVIGQNMKQGATVIYESTVYPGATEEVCIPILEEESSFVWEEDFFVGYSPERINPGDKRHTLTKVIKVVSGDSAATLDRVAALYEMIVEPGVHRAPSIKVAEAAKVIENTQRDLNIALMNELALIFNKLEIDTADVLAAAGTKWNFMPFKPGLVGGHCIGVDPYYLTYKAETVGYYPQVILSGRRINDGMGKYIAEQTVKQLLSAGHPIVDTPINVLGLTFKENCSDLRNTRVVDLIRELSSYGADVHVHDPEADPLQAEAEHGIALEKWIDLPVAAAVILAVPHQYYLDMPVADLKSIIYGDDGVFIDIKSAINERDLEDLLVWRL